MRINGLPLTPAEAKVSEKKLFPSNERLNKPLVDPKYMSRVAAQPSTEDKWVINGRLTKPLADLANLAQVTQQPQLKNSLGN